VIKSTPVGFIFIMNPLSVIANLHLLKSKGDLPSDTYVVFAINHMV
jgi:hypothetical protein